MHHRADHRVHQAGRAGMAVSELARQHGFSPASFYAWRAKYGGMEAEDAKRLKGLESENNRSEEHTSELQSLMRISYAVFCLKKKTKNRNTPTDNSNDISN